MLASLELLRFYPATFATLIGIVGLLIGSFLNVVVYRLPIMLSRGWQRDARDILELEQPMPSVFNLATPNSRCPLCTAAIRPWQNIPVVSWIALGGKCSCCKSKISIRYPAVELATALLSFLTAWHFGYGVHLAFALVLVWGAIPLFLIDVDEMLLPDAIVLPGIWIGLTASYLGLFSSLENAFIGAVAGYLVLALPAWLFMAVSGRRGMGNGDFKLLALFGAWLGWQALPIVILISAVTGSMFGLIELRVRAKPYPFGPFIIASGLLALFFGHELYAFYGAVSGVRIGANFFE